MRRSTDQWHSQIALRRGVVIGLPIAAVTLTVTLYPFAATDPWPAYPLYTLVWGKSHLADMAQNVMLFVPAGIVLSWLMAGFGVGQRGQVWGATLLAALFALGIELAQLCIPERSAALADVLTNALGAGLGSRWLAPPLAPVIDQIGGWVLTVTRQTSATIATLGLTLWLTSAGWLLAHWQQATLPTNWSDYYTLQIGAANDGQRFWPGYVRTVSLYDRPLGVNNIDHATIPLFAYDMTRNPTLESGRFVQPLIAQGKPAFTPNGVNVGYQRWLMSRESLRGISATIAQARAFTVIVEAAPRDPTRTTEGFIVNYGREIDGHNISLIQAGHDLRVRMRLPLTRPVNDRPALVFSNVFVDASPHQIIFSYDGAVARLVVDGQPHRQWYALGPGEALVNRWLPMQAHQVGGWSIALSVVCSLPLALVVAPWRGSCWLLGLQALIGPFMIGYAPSLITTQPLSAAMTLASAITTLIGISLVFWVTKPSRVGGSV